MAINYKNREISSYIYSLLDIPETIVLHGARQVGKTSLMRMIIEQLEKKGEKDNIMYFDLEKEKYLEILDKGYDEFVKYVYANLGREHKKIYLFIDEVQYLKNPSSLLKLLYDNHKGEIKVIATGSSSFAIKSKFKDSLVGRIIDLEILGLSFKEFLEFKNEKINLNSDSEFAHEDLKKLYQEYMIYGFYPQVVLADKIELKELYLNNIMEKYLYKDIRDLANIKDIKKFNNLLVFLANQTGSLVNVNELSDTLNIARQTIDEYLFILENTYIIKLLHPFSKNIRSELSKMPKVFFEDLGMLNVLKNKGSILENIDGDVFENSVYCYLRRILDNRYLYFWRTTAKQEVDFVYDKNDLIPAEVKLKYRRKNMKNLLYFANNYETDKIYCVTFEKDLKNIKNDKVIQVYPWEMEEVFRLK